LEAPKNGESKAEESKEGSSDNDEATTTEEKTDGTSGDDTKKDLFIQWTFDVLYLRSCTTSTASKDVSDSLLKAEDALWKQSGLEKAARERMAKSAKDYWQRTNLLFGLLA
jgi:hypothetical protein